MRMSRRSLPSSSPCREELYPLDKDDEFIYYNTLFGWGTGAPDFYPTLTAFCDVDHGIADQQVQDLIDRIQGNPQQGVPDVAEDMTRAFIALYNRVINQVNNASPPLPPAIAALQAQLPELQAKVNILNKFLQTFTSP